MKIVRALIAAAAALAIGAAVQFATAPSASAVGTESSLCAICWGVVQQ